MTRRSLTDTLAERLAVAFVSAVAAVLTLALYPVALVLIAGGRGGGGGAEFEFAAYLYRFVFSNLGLFIITGSSVVGFLAGPERMANIFSFFWGTHSFWSDVGNRLDEFQANHNVGLWVLVVLLAILAVVIYQSYA